MKLKYILLLLSVVFIITSCFQNKSAKEKETATVETTTDESFNSFLKNFNKKPSFQRRRVIFPLEATLLDPSEYGMNTVDVKITYQEWILLDFTYDSTYATRKMDSYKQYIRMYSDSSIIEHRGINNGIFANYYFMKKDGKWFLKSFTDVSY